ncbi:hypothetical protein QBC46DRAFT_92058 [Diplogelasinospora grovesii]|uniref:Biogenesis of lysosome-related organelles complex 1 subunit 1 n=1 Tax=Diplogelasinospora grovesii TaxID=303347 RepID=A0AAN6S6K9_9PEZI|nr:hypothetical protein QBC46DRAFT_92058 [Diplogelasinospora grovesii]
MSSSFPPQQLQPSSASISTTGGTCSVSTSNPSAPPSAASPPPSSTAGSSVSSPPHPHPQQQLHPPLHGHQVPGLLGSAGPAGPAAPHLYRHHGRGAPHSATASSQSQSQFSNTLPTPSTQRQIEEARNAVVASIGNMMDRELQGRAALLHSNNTAIEKQEKDVTKALDGLRKENDKLQKLATEHAKKVKEIGNVQNWAEMLEREFIIIEETLRLVREGSDSGSYSGSWSGSESGRSRSPSPGREAAAQSDSMRRDDDGDVIMTEGDDGQPQVHAQKADKGKGKEVDPSHTSMDVDASTFPTEPISEDQNRQPNEPASINQGEQQHHPQHVLKGKGKEVVDSSDVIMEMQHSAPVPDPTTQHTFEQAAI